MVTLKTILCIPYQTKLTNSSIILLRNTKNLGSFNSHHNLPYYKLLLSSICSFILIFMIPKLIMIFYHLYCYCLGLYTCLLISCSPFLFTSCSSGFHFHFPNFHPLYLEEENYSFSESLLVVNSFSLYSYSSVIT